MMAILSLLGRRESIRRITMGTAVMDKANDWMETIVEKTNEVVDALIDKTTVAVETAYNFVDSVALRVAQELVPIWYRMTPEVRIPVLVVCVSVRFFLASCENGNNVCGLCIPPSAVFRLTQFLVDSLWFRFNSSCTCGLSISSTLLP
jgi:hypothetical protein